jgi:predicted lipoprotein with Yx(FWY)xxD motif
MERSLMIAVCASSAFGLLSIAAPGPGAVRATEAAKVAVSQKEPVGEYLTDAEGRSLYLFEADSENTSTCHDDCAAAWPPLLTEGAPTGDDKVDASMLSTIEREDGSTQVTYNGWPLYYFVKDQAPGDTEGQDVEGFGAEWYLVSPEGEKAEGE